MTASTHHSFQNLCRCQQFLCHLRDATLVLLLTILEIRTYMHQERSEQTVKTTDFERSDQISDWLKRMISGSIILLEGHSCKIGNVQTLAGIKAKSMLEVFWTCVCYWFVFLSMKKAIGNLNKYSDTFVPPNFVTPMSRHNTAIFQIFLSSKYW